MRIKFLIALGALVVLVAATGIAEDPAQLALRVADAQTANLAQFQHYSWSIDATIAVDGTVKAHVVSNERFNEKGEVVFDVVTSETTVKRKRGLRGRSQQAQMEEMSAFLNHVLSVAASYAVMTKGEQVDFFDKATITEGSGDTAGMLTAVSKDVSVKGDEVTKQIVAETLFVKSITFETVVDGVPVTGEILYRPIEGGPNVPRMATIDIPSQSQVVELEFMNYAKQL
jgi:hypothetical protein